MSIASNKLLSMTLTNNGLKTIYNRGYMKIILSLVCTCLLATGVYAIVICDDSKCTETNIEETFPTKKVCVNRLEEVVNGYLPESALDECKRYDLQYTDLKILVIQKTLKDFVLEYNSKSTEEDKLAVLNTYADKIKLLK